MLDIMPMMRMKFGLLVLLAQWVACSDAWFWSWTPTTTQPPTVEHEGSGIPAGSGELPLESSEKVGGAIINEGLGIQKVAQTWDEPEDPLLTTLIPSTPAESEHASKGSAGASPIIRESGNGTSSLNVMASVESDHLQFTGNESRVNSEVESGSTLDAGSGQLSSSRLMPELAFTTGTSLGSAFEKVAVILTDHRGLDDVGSTKYEQKPKFEDTPRTDRNSAVGPGMTETEQRFGSHAENLSNNDQSAVSSSHWKDVHVVSYDSRADFLTLHFDNNVEASGVSQDNHEVEVTQLTAGEYTPSWDVLQTSQPLSSTETPSTTQTNTYNKTPDTNFVPIAIHPPTSQALTNQTARTGHIGHVLDVPEASVTNQKLRQATLFSQTDVDIQAPTENFTLDTEPPQCLLLDTALPFCSYMVGEKVAVPNYFNHSTVEEVQSVLSEWAWLLRSRCHHSLEWFFCLLLVPKCGSVVQLPVLPCQSFCQVLLDSCWTLLDEGHLPVECHTLPDEEDDGYQCLSVSNQKGNRWFRWILF